MSIPCTLDIVRGKMANYSGQSIQNCSSCSGCTTKSYSQHAGVIDDFRVVMIGEDVTLRWSCPSCGLEVVEEVKPLFAIDIASEIQNDPLCYTCRCKANIG